MIESTAAQRTYRYPRRTWWSWAGAFLVSLAVCGGAIALQFSPRVDGFARGQLLIFTAVFAALATYAYGALRVVSHPVGLSTEGIVTGGAVVPWGRVRRVDIQPLLRRMDVYDEAGARVLRLRPELEAFSGVQAYIIEHMEPDVESPPAGVALLTPVSGVVPLAAFGLIAVWFGPRQSGVPAVLFAVAAAFVLVLFALRRRTLRLESDALVLRQGQRSVRVPYAAITAVRVAHERARRRESVLVVLERGAEEPILLAGFRGGWRAAAATIERAWRAGVQS